MDSRAQAVAFAEEQLRARRQDAASYAVVRAMQLQPGQWLIAFDRKDVLDAKVEMVVDAAKRIVISCRDAWA